MKLQLLSTDKASVVWKKTLIPQWQLLTWEVTAWLLPFLWPAAPKPGEIQMSSIRQRSASQQEKQIWKVTPYNAKYL